MSQSFKVYAGEGRENVTSMEKTSELNCTQLSIKGAQTNLVRKIYRIL